MARQVYLNRREGIGREIAALAAIPVAVLLGVGVIYFLFFTPGATEEKTPPPEPQLTSAADAETGCIAQMLPETEPAAFGGTRFTCSSADVARVWEMIRNSPHVTGNRLYATILANTKFVYNAGDDSVNAFATSIEKTQVRHPVVCLLGGAARFSRLIATALAYDRCGVREDAVELLLSRMTSADWFRISEARAAELSRVIEPSDGAAASGDGKPDAHKVDVVRNEILHGILLSVLAHEAGHLAYGHVHTQAASRGNLEISRNQERDADSFCASVMSSSPYGKYMFEGGIFWWWVMARQEMNETTDSTRSHPLSRERFKNMIRANESLARKLGITEAESEKLWQ